MNKKLTTNYIFISHLFIGGKIKYTSSIM